MVLGFPGHPTGAPVVLSEAQRQGREDCFLPSAGLRLWLQPVGSVWLLTGRPLWLFPVRGPLPQVAMDGCFIEDLCVVLSCLASVVSHHLLYEPWGGARSGILILVLMPSAGE